VVASGSGTMATTLTPAPTLVPPPMLTPAPTLAPAQHIWLAEIDIVYVPGTSKVKISLQSRLMQGIFHGAFELVRCHLVFVHAFPDAVAVTPCVAFSR
jgi:hypothetical protein